MRAALSSHFGAAGPVVVVGGLLACLLALLLVVRLSTRCLRRSTSAGATRVGAAELESMVPIDDLDELSEQEERRAARRVQRMRGFD